MESRFKLMIWHVAECQRLLRQIRTPTLNSKFKSLWYGNAIRNLSIILSSTDTVFGKMLYQQPWMTCRMKTKEYHSCLVHRVVTALDKLKLIWHVLHDIVIDKFPVTWKKISPGFPSIFIESNSFRLQAVWYGFAIRLAGTSWWTDCGVQIFFRQLKVNRL